jgi:hypothetical protein
MHILFVFTLTLLLFCQSPEETKIKAQQDTLKNNGDSQGLLKNHHIANEAFTMSLLPLQLYKY